MLHVFFKPENTQIQKKKGNTPYMCECMCVRVHAWNTYILKPLFIRLTNFANLSKSVKGHIAHVWRPFLSPPGRECSYIKWGGARAAAKHPIVHRTNNPNSRSTKVEKPCLHLPVIHCTNVTHSFP